MCHLHPFILVLVVWFFQNSETQTTLSSPPRCVCKTALNFIAILLSRSFLLGDPIGRVIYGLLAGIACSNTAGGMYVSCCKTACVEPLFQVLWGKSSSFALKGWHSVGYFIFTAFSLDRIFFSWKRFIYIYIFLSPSEVSSFSNHNLWRPVSVFNYRIRYVQSINVQQETRQEIPKNDKYFEWIKSNKCT